MTETDTLYDAAMKLRDAGDLPAAIAKLQEIETLDPKHALTHSAMAILFQRLGRIEEALAHANKVTELEPNDPFSFTQLSVICQRCGRIQEAEDARDRAKMMGGRGH